MHYQALIIDRPPQHRGNGESWWCDSVAWVMFAEQLRPGSFGGLVEFTVEGVDAAITQLLDALGDEIAANMAQALPGRATQVIEEWSLWPASYQIQICTCTDGRSHRWRDLRGRLPVKNPPGRPPRGHDADTARTGDRIRAERDAHPEWTYEEIAEVLAIDSQTVGRYLRANVS